MSLATASQFYNVSPKSGSSSEAQNRTTIEDKRKLYLDPNNSSQLSVSTTKQLPTESADIVSFKPNEYPKHQASTSDNLMSFGGPSIMQNATGKDSVHDSTLIKPFDETTDTKANHNADEFFYSVKSRDEDD